MQGSSYDYGQGITNLVELFDLKIDVSTAAIVNQPRFKGKRVLTISGERAQESKARSNYKYFEPDRTHGAGRHVDRLRPVHGWKEEDVWGIIQRYGVIVHPCYYLGFARCSCKFCIFGNANQFASAAALSPLKMEQLAIYEDSFGKTIKRNISLRNLVAKGIPYEGIAKYPHIAEQAVSSEYTLGIFTNEWELPLGAYGESDGPM